MGDASTSRAPSSSRPHLESSSDGHRLVVNGKPFLMLGAELHNSSFSCPEYMREVWPFLKVQNINTVFANVSWEAIEPTEGCFDYTKLDQAVEDARRHELRLVLLWFGAFKNGMSTYAPSWVKKDVARFPRAQLPGLNGKTKTSNALSIFYSEVAEADAAAFRDLMQHLRHVDEAYSTVLMVQVENEVGLLGASRDMSSEATNRFRAPVPQQLVTMLTDQWDTLHPSLQKNLSYFRQNAREAATSSWIELFGESSRTEEIFMAYHYALYVEYVAKAGKHEYPLPLFTNVWQNYQDEDADRSKPTLVGGGGGPGDYPSGGAVINVLDIWQSFAPSLDFISPDIYLNDYDSVCRKYAHRRQPLLIPEQRRDDYGARRVWSAYGTHHALCAAPFGIDTLTMAESPWKKHYGLLVQVQEYVLAVQARKYQSIGFFFDEIELVAEKCNEISAQFGDWDLTIDRSFVFGKPGPGFGMVIHLEEACFLLVGAGFEVRFSSSKEESVFSGILRFEEKVYDSRTKTLHTGRLLNGDETRSGEAATMPGESPDYGDFSIAITIPARTMIAECEVYAI